MATRSRVFILGAGASKTENAPLTWEFLFESFKMAQEAPEHPLAKAWKTLGRFLDLLYGVNYFFATLEHADNYSLRIKSINIEEVFTLVESALQRREGFSKDFPPSKLVNLRDSLIFIIGKTLSEKLKGRGTSQHHLDFLRRHIESEQESNDIIVSFNYDILIDNAISHEWMEEKFGYSYGLKFRSFISVDGENVGIPLSEHDKQVLLLKPHGSLNWLICPTCGRITCFLHQKIFEEIYHSFGRGYQNDSNLSCPDDHSRLGQCIIPPTFHKDFSQRAFQDIWQLFEESVRGANQLFVLGYSLPEADLNTRYILKRALAQNRNKDVIITIVNKIRERSGSDVFAKLRSFFGNQYKYEEINDGFEGFARPSVGTNS